MKTLTFHNNTPLDPKSFKFMGLSVKQDNSFGLFGTGFKYAIATILRLGDEIEIVSEGQRYFFTLGKMNFRGKDFSTILCNGEEMPYTTELGKLWEPWFAYRELFCNARDEDKNGGVVIGNKHNATTQIIVKGDVISQVHAKRDMYFLDPKAVPLWEDDEVQVFNGSSRSYYYQGVLVGNCSDSPYTYNFKSGITLSEDRLDRYSICMPINLARRLKACDDKEIVSQFVGEKTCDLAKHMCWDGGQDASQSFVEVVKSVYDKTRNIPSGFKGEFVKLNPDVCDEEKLPLSEREEKMLKKASSILEKAGFPVSRYPVSKISTEGVSLFGMAEIKQKEIYLTDESFKRGMFDFCKTLLEEFAHCHTGYGDFTREFQEWLFSSIVLQVEARLDEVL
jgi:hypothetical protein